MIGGLDGINFGAKVSFEYNGNTYLGKLAKDVTAEYVIETYIDGEYEVLDSTQVTNVEYV